MLNEYPVHWLDVSLEDFATFIDYRGKTPTKTNEGIPLITAKNIRNGFIDRDPKEYIAPQDYDDWMTRGFPKYGDILITTEAPLGNIAQIDIKEKFALAQRAICLQPYAYETSRYFYYFLRSNEFQSLLDQNSTGTTVKGIKASILKKMMLKAPPLAEQHQIAQRLDELLAQVDTIKARLDAIPAILKRFRQSVLSAAVSGKLTEEWRGNSELIDWKEYSLSQLINKPSYGSSAKSDKEGKIPVLRMGNIQNGKIDWSDLVYSSDDDEIKKYTLEKNDVLFNRTNSPELVGKTAIYKGEQKAIYAGYLIKVRCQSSLDPDYLNFHLNSPQAKHYCMFVKTDGVSQSNINAQKLGAYIINCPPINEQHEIVRRVESFLNFSEQITLRINEAKSRIDKLTQSILAKAFRGELTAEWRAEHPELISGENSAEALLAKIQAAKAALDGKKTRKKTS